jgi:hypothetical protein
MSTPLLQRIPVVGGLGYVERVRRLPGSFTATLSVERENPYFPHAIAVMVNGEKVGYVAPEVARGYFEPLAASSGPPATCPGRRAAASDHETSGVELLLDFSTLPVEPLA